MAIKKKSPSSSGKTTSFKIIPVSVASSAMSALVYGRSGTGKTTFASTWPKPILLIDIREKGTESIANVKDVDVVQLENWQQFEEVYWMLKDGDSKYKTVVVDQLTQLQDLAIAQAMKDDGKDPDDQISKRNWGQGAGLMKTWCLNYRDLVDLGINVVLLAHDRAKEGEEGDEDQIEPSVGARVMPSVASFINGAVSIIGNTFIRESFSIEKNRRVRSVEYAMRLGPHAYYTTKTRTPVGINPPEWIENPSYEKIVAIVRGKSETATSTVKRK